MDMEVIMKRKRLCNNLTFEKEKVILKLICVSLKEKDMIIELRAYLINRTIIFLFENLLNIGDLFVSFYQAYNFIASILYKL